MLAVVVLTTMRIITHENGFVNRFLKKILKTLFKEK